MKIPLPGEVRKIFQGILMEIIFKSGSRPDGADGDADALPLLAGRSLRDQTLG